MPRLPAPPPFSDHYLPGSYFGTCRPRVHVGPCVGSEWGFGRRCNFCGHSAADEGEEGQRLRAGIDPEGLRAERLRAGIDPLSGLCSGVTDVMAWGTTSETISGRGARRNTAGRSINFTVGQISIFGS